MQHSAAPMHCQHCKDDQNFTIHAAPGLARGAIEHQSQGYLHRYRSSQAPMMMKISPSTQRIALRTQLPNTNAGACCLDTATTNSNDEALCRPPSPRTAGRRWPKAGWGALFAPRRRLALSSLSSTTASTALTDCPCTLSNRSVMAASDFARGSKRWFSRSMQVRPRGRPKSEPEMSLTPFPQPSPT